MRGRLQGGPPSRRKPFVKPLPKRIIRFFLQKSLVLQDQAGAFPHVGRAQILVLFVGLDEGRGEYGRLPEKLPGPVRPTVSLPEEAALVQKAGVLGAGGKTLAAEGPGGGEAGRYRKEQKKDRRRGTIQRVRASKHGEIHLDYYTAGPDASKARGEFIMRNHRIAYLVSVLIYAIILIGCGDNLPASNDEESLGAALGPYVEFDAASGAVDVSWKPQGNVDGYIVYRSRSSGADGETWEEIGRAAGASAARLRDAGGVAAEVFRYKVVAYRGEKTWASPTPPDTGYLDFDNDGAPNAAELAVGRDPLLFDIYADTDGDGVQDRFETGTGVWVSGGDTGTNPLNPDTDGDGLVDGVERNTGEWVSAENTGTDPLDPDTDEDGASDGEETNTGEWVSSSDTGTNPLEADNHDLLKPVDPVENLGAFGSEEELVSYFKAKLLPKTSPYYYDLYPSSVFDDGDSGREEEGFSLGQDDSEEHSTTNVQETGVDESDAIKTDGEYLYIAKGAEVRIVRAVPADEMEVVAVIETKGRVDSLYLYGNILAALYNYYPGYDSSYYYDSGGETDPIEGLPEGRNYQKTGMVVIDISDPVNPKVKKRILYEGRLVSSRVTGGRLHLVQQFSPRIAGLQYGYYTSEEEVSKAEEHNRSVLEGLAPADLAPAYYSLDADDAVAASGQAVGYANFYKPKEPRGTNIIFVVTLDLENLGEGFKAIAVVGQVDTVYASTRALYLINRDYSSYTGWDEGYDYREKTVIRKFDLTGEWVRYVAGGCVWGSVLNQFSLGEYDDILRIATTTGHVSRGGGGSSRNHVFLLAERAGALKIIGKLENIAPTERIYSARFIGERGFLVTFKKVDPLFTLDLSDPEKPKVAGELKVPGYSDYIHILEENHLLTIGKDTIEGQGGNFAWYQGVQLSVFDVSDFANPALLHKEVIGDRGSSSEALYNHKAFTFWRARELLAVPIELYEVPAGESWDNQQWGSPRRSPAYGEHTFTGLYVYRVTAEDGIELQGRISTEQESYYYGYSAWTRGVFIGDYVYAATENAIKAAKLGSMDGTVWSFELED